MNPDTMTLTELRDWHARNDGWRYETGPIWQWRKCNEQGELVASLNPVPDDHPFPATLDGAAAAMPLHWWWRKFDAPRDITRWEAFRMDPDHIVELAGTDCEITDRYRLGMKAKLAEKETKHGT